MLRSLTYQDFSYSEQRRENLQVPKERATKALSGSFYKLFDITIREAQKTDLKKNGDFRFLRFSRKPVNRSES